MTFRMTKSYPLEPDGDHVHDMSQGLRRHFPALFLVRVSERGAEMLWVVG